LKVNQFLPQNVGINPVICPFLCLLHDLPRQKSKNRPAFLPPKVTSLTALGFSANTCLTIASSPFFAAKIKKNEAQPASL